MLAMKPLRISLLTVLICSLVSCNRIVEVPATKNLEDKFQVSFPQPKSAIDNVVLSDDQDNLVQSLNHLGFNLLEANYCDEGEVLSPLSIYLALSMVINGADGNTYKQLADLLGGNTEAINGFSSALLKQLPAVDMDARLRLANALIVNEDYSLSGSYKALVESTFYAPVETLPFDDESLVLRTVNGWCDKATEGLIPSIIDEVNPGTMAYLLEALYFKSAWTKPILHTQHFAFAGGEKLDFLCGSEEVLYGRFDKYEAVARDYGKNGKYKFYILLPTQKDGLEDMLAILKTKDWKQVAGSMEKKSITFAFPEFKLGSSMKLKKTLCSLGVTEAFSDKADFSKMFEEKALIEDVLHKAVVEVDSNGTEAAAVTTVIVESNSILNEGMIDFFADHPFVFVIAESTSDTILFAGVFEG